MSFVFLQFQTFPKTILGMILATTTSMFIYRTQKIPQARKERFRTSKDPRLENIFLKRTIISLANIVQVFLNGDHVLEVDGHRDWDCSATVLYVQKTIVLRRPFFIFSFEHVVQINHHYDNNILDFVFVFLVKAETRIEIMSNANLLIKFVFIQSSQKMRLQ